MPFPLLPILILGGAAAIVAVVATRGSRYALSEDCQVSELATMGPDEVQKWLTDQLAPKVAKAYEGKGVVAMRPVDGQSVPQFVVDEIALCRAGGGFATGDHRAGLTESEICGRIDGRTVYMPVDPEDPQFIALYLYQQVAHPNCAVLVIKDWGGINVTEFVQWPSQAAECLFYALMVAMKMELLAKTLDDKYAVTPEELAKVASVCPQSRAAWSPRPQPTGLSVGAAAAGGLDYHRMARDANAGQLHPAHVLTGAIFR
jgi:hypothetical protein